jgi:selenide,water dikinase
LSELAWEDDERFIVTPGDYEDAALLRYPPGMAVLQSLDFFTPIVNDPYGFGQIAAANALSDIYAMGGDPYSAMNIVCFPSKRVSLSVLKEILRGGLDKIKEAGAVMAGGHSVEDDEIKYGLAVTGIVEPERYASNKSARPGEHLLLTKPLGTGVLATAVKGKWDNADALERDLIRWGSRLNAAGARVIRELALTGATDVTGFGLGGHLLEMARASKVRIRVWSERVPIIEQARELASIGFLPAGSYANKHYCSEMVELAEAVDTVTADMIFDAQTSGGLILAMPEEQLDQARRMLLEAGEMAAHIGVVLEGETGLEIV